MRDIFAYIIALAVLAGVFVLMDAALFGLQGLPLVYGG